MASTDPVSTHTGIWPFPRSEVQAGGANLSLLWEEFNIQHITSSLLSRKLSERVHGKPEPEGAQGGWGGSGGLGGPGPGFGLSCCRNVKEIPPPPGRRGRKAREFDTVSGSEREAAESEGADWTTVRQPARSERASSLRTSRPSDHLIGQSDSQTMRWCDGQTENLLINLFLSSTTKN